jgi:hypothetical protein
LKQSLNTKFREVRTPPAALAKARQRSDRVSGNSIVPPKSGEAPPATLEACGRIEDRYDAAKIASNLQDD